MNNKIMKLTGILTTGALVITLGAGALFVSNTTVSAASVDEEVTTSRIEGQRRERPEGLEGLRGEKPEGIESLRGSKGGRASKEVNKGGADIEGLVEAGLLSEDQLEALEIFKEEQMAEREAQKELVEAMTDEEREAYKEERQSEEKPKVFDTLVEQGIISTEEAIALETYIQEQKAIQRNDKFTSELEPLLEDGTLTSSDLDAIISFLNEQEPKERPDKSEFVEGEEKPEKVSPFDEMVEEEIITTEQAEAIEALMKPARRGRK